jgi:hypothetical protein
MPSSTSVVLVPLAERLAAAGTRRQPIVVAILGDQHNSAGRFGVLQTALDKKVGVANIVEVK